MTNLNYFKCYNSNCSQEFSSASLRIAAFLYGLILLVGEKSGYIGVVCPKCLQTSLKELNLDQFFKIKSELGNQIFYATTQEIRADTFAYSKDYGLGIFNNNEINELRTTSEGLIAELKYNTFAHDPQYLLYNFNSPLKHNFSYQSYENYGYDGPKSFHIISGTIHSRESIGSTQTELFSKMNFDTYRKNYFFSYITHTPITGDYLNIFGFRTDEIYRLLEIENKLKRKIFPRYYYTTNMRSACEEFCKNKYIKQEMRPLPRNSIYEYRWQRSKLESKLKLGHEKEQILMSLAFLELLKEKDLSLDSQKDAFKALWKTNHLFKGIGIPKSLSDVDLSLYDQTVEENKYSNMYNKVWSSFKKENMQKEFTRKSKEFNEEYHKLSKNIDWSEAAIWELKKKYILDLYNKSAHLHGEKLISEDLISLIKRVHPEINMLYNAIKALGLSGVEPGVDKKWREAALNAFNENESLIKIIKKSYLEDINLYAFSYGQERRDFIGVLLKMIAEDNNLSPTGSQTLYKIYRQHTD